MLKRQKRILVFFYAIFSIMSGMAAGASYADEVISFGPRETRIEGAIKYSLIGEYKAHFNIFKGKVILDRSKRIESVYLEIEAGSVKSNHPWCDKLARSRRLLDAARYPKIIFRSDKITRDEGGYKVRGILEMHGIKRRLTFPFESRIGKKSLDIRGSWNINRKDFNIIWNKYLDHGGIVVSDVFTVDWGIKASLI